MRAVVVGNRLSQVPASFGRSRASISGSAGGAGGRGVGGGGAACNNTYICAHQVVPVNARHARHAITPSCHEL